MLQVVLALYAEGNTDGNIDEGYNKEFTTRPKKRLGFLPPIITRTTKNILTQHGKSLSDIEIQLLYSRWKKPDGITDRDRCILHVAGETVGYHALIIHSDGDDRGYEQTIAELFQPGKDLVSKIAKDKPNDVCVNLVPIIPVRMTEAWMLADPVALCTVLDTEKKAQTLGIPLKAKEVEQELAPKTTLDLVIKRAYPNASRSERERLKDDLYKDLGPKISLKRLSNVPSYQQFEKDLTATLQTLNFIQK